ncbi:MAG: 3-dehydroquinate synthase [Chloroflexi bacterium]|nr:3-dehydroquinate synthase [Chloroflexota bacterium]MBI3931096.1 3-dehydroquinate synthase [Chloroflexota bacterium]
MKKVRVKLGINSYDIHIGRGLLRQTGRRLKEIGFSDKLVIITDPTVRRLYGTTLKESLTSSGFKVAILEVAEGEEQKSLETAGQLYHELTDGYAERNTPVLALGGGVIGDLTGFVAATYLRGVPLIQIPTTLLAQVDSSIGGKVAVNHGSLKNKIGAFYQPRLVISDITTLETLTAGELSDGLAETIKYGVIRDEALFSYLEENIDRIKALDESTLETIVSRSAKIKAEVVAKDERDFGLRNILNYGHTVGHAIESVSDFKVRHGEAVAIGMLAAARISNELGMLDKNELIRLKNVIGRAGLPTEVPDLQRARLIPAIKHDKKIFQGKIRFVLPKSIGDVFVSEEVSPSLIEQVLLNWN